MLSVWRFRFLSLFIFFLYLLIAGRLFYWQVIKGSQLSLKAQSQYSKITQTWPLRGEIRAFDNFPLAYFAVNKEYAEFFATSRSKDGLGFVLPFFLSIKNPLDLTRFGIDQVSPDDFFNWMFLKTGLTETELDINPIMLKGSMKPHPIWVYLRNNPKMIQKIAKSNIYDGIVFHEFCPNLDINDDGYKTKAYVIFDAHQAKLADPNRGDVVLASLKSFLLKKGGKV